MADHIEQVERLWDEWAEYTGQDSGDPDDFIEWGLANRKLALRPQDVRKLLRGQVTQALRQSRRWDEEGGFTYRAKQSVTLIQDGVATKHYFDIDKGGTPAKRQKSFRQRREGVADDVYRAVCDVERMNRNFPNDPQLTFYPSFEDDIAEHRAAEKSECDRGDEAA